MDKYSAKEIEMFTNLGLAYYLPISYWAAPTLYKYAGELAFLNNQQGPAVESLRRCLKAMWDCRLHRNTQEWDELIKLEE
jgi:hypothetical protein